MTIQSSSTWRSHLLPLLRLSTPHRPLHTSSTLFQRVPQYQEWLDLSSATTTNGSEWIRPIRKGADGSTTLNDSDSDSDSGSGSGSGSEIGINPSDFKYHPNFLTPFEQSVLIKVGLWKLNRVDPELRRRKRRRAKPGVEGSGAGAGADASQDEGARVTDDAAGQEQESSAENLQRLFDLETPSKFGFEEGHFDSVIAQYRESLITTLPPIDTSSSASSAASLGSSEIDPSYPSILRKLYSLLPPASSSSSSLPTSTPTPNNDSTTLPPPNTSTHALHLSPEGYILPHVDNVQASGSVIIGVSLGAERILRLERKAGDEQQNQRKTKEREGWEVLLRSGSVYIQR